MNEMAGLPPHLTAAWGLRERPTKGPKPSLSLERIVEAGVKVAESDGLAAVSMSRVAAQLGASTMSLYRYVTNKDELLALMMDAALGPPPGRHRLCSGAGGRSSESAPASAFGAAPADEGWREGLIRWARAQRDVLLRHRWAMRVPLTGPPLTPNQIGWLEWGLGYLRRTGLEAGQKMSVIILLSSYVWRASTIESDLIEAAKAAESTVEEALAGYGQVLARLADPGRFPEVHAVIAEGAFDDGDDEPDAEFTFGLERILDGVEVLIRRR